MTVDVRTMEVKKPTQTTSVAKEEKKSPMPKVDIKNFVGEVKAEIKKISWTSPEELKLYTKVVVMSTFIFGLCIYFVDLIIQLFLNGLGTIFRLIGG